MWIDVIAVDWRVVSTCFVSAVMYGQRARKHKRRLMNINGGVRERGGGAMGCKERERERAGERSVQLSKW